MKGKQVRKLLGRCTSIFKKSIKCMAIFMIAIAVVTSSLNVYADSETGVPEYEKDADGNLLPDEDRLTKVGKFVRSTSIDELPQLINVLKGD